jgi:hypothetical protein
MPFSTCRLDGYACFGLVTMFQPTPRTARRQIDEYFGVNGSTSLFGGTNGWDIVIDGVLFETSMSALNNDIAFLCSFVDANIHQLQDTSGNTWQNVVFDGELRFDPAGPMLANGMNYWARAYSAVFHTLTFSSG